MNKRLHILIIGLGWPPETFLARLIRGLVAADVHVTVALPKRPGKDWDSLPNLDWLRIPVGQGAGAMRLLRTGKALAGATIRSPRTAARLVRQMTLDREGIVQLQRRLSFLGRTWDLIYIPWNAAAIDNLPLFDIAPVVISCRGAQINIVPHNPKRPELHAGLRETFHRAAAVHCVSEAILLEAEHYGLERQKARIINPAVDPGFFRPPSPGPPVTLSPFRLITTGSLIWRKGYEYLLSAVRLLVDRGIPLQLDIIGDGAERQRVIYTIHDLGLADHVTLLGRLPPNQVLPRLQQADAFVLSSLSEGISNAVLEAMACGLPVVTTDCGGMKEAVSDGVEGFVVPIRQPQAMASALEMLWMDAALRERMGRAGRERILGAFTLQQQIEAFVQLFYEVAA
jgi:glycosyltransferase involved in cell wall biosynthesis